MRYMNKAESVENHHSPSINSASACVRPVSGFLHEMIGEYTRRREEPVNKTIVRDQTDFSASCSHCPPARIACMRVPRHYLVIAFPLRIEMGGHTRRSVLVERGQEPQRRQTRDGFEMISFSRPGRNFTSLSGAARKSLARERRAELRLSPRVGRRSVLLCVTVHGPNSTYRRGGS